MDLVQFVALLNELWEWAGRPGFKRRLEDLAKAHPDVGPGQLSGSTAHRVLSGQQDLTRMVGGPERFVRAFTTTLGADPEQWLAALEKLLPSSDVPADPAAMDAAPLSAALPGWRRMVRSRRLLVIAVALVLVSAGLITWGLLAQESSPEPRSELDYSRPAEIESGGTGLRLAVAQDSEQPGTRAVVVGAGTARWDLIAPYRDNPSYIQVRPAGMLLRCLEVTGGSFEDRAAVQIWGCNGEPHQYWKALPAAAGTVLFTNLNSGQCLSVASGHPQAGMQLVQRECDAAQSAQQWRVHATNDRRAASSSAAASVTPGKVGPDPVEYPGGGKDQPCAGLSPGLDPSGQSWSSQPFLVRNEDPVRGKVSVGPETSGLVELLRANRTNADGKEETFYWAEGFVLFTPKQFAMALQWTTVPGPGGWHTCSVNFTIEHGRPPTVALPRDPNLDGVRDVWFRICLTYQPEREPGPVVNCAGRY